MRLFLSSQDLGNHAGVAARLAGGNTKAALVRNAGDGGTPAERNENTPLKIQMFKDAGLDLEEIDLRDYFGKQDELARKLIDFGSVWCSGGNTFILRRAMRASGFDQIVKQRLANDDILYGGWSAGACICAPSLHGIEYGDRPDPEDVPDGYPDQTIIWEGLDLIPFMIVPHCDQEWFQDHADGSIAYLRQNDIPYEALNDGQVVIIDGDRCETLL